MRVETRLTVPLEEVSVSNTFVLLPLSMPNSVRLILGSPAVLLAIVLLSDEDCSACSLDIFIPDCKGLLSNADSIFRRFLRECIETQPL